MSLIDFFLPNFNIRYDIAIKILNEQSKIKALFRINVANFSAVKN